MIADRIVAKCIACRCRYEAEHDAYLIQGVFDEFPAGVCNRCRKESPRFNRLPTTATQNRAEIVP